MELHGINWKCESGDFPQMVVKVDFENSDIQQAKYVADRKMNYVDVHSPGGIKRRPEIIRSRIIAGKLADAAVFELLTQSLKRRSLNWQLKEYDKIRNDDFQFPDPYDLLIIDAHGKSAEIEVRSSFAYRLLPQEKIVNKLSVYGWYTSQNKLVEKHHDWYWQVIYYMRPRDKQREVGWPETMVFEDCVENGAVTAFIVGGACKTYLEDNTYTSIRCDQDNAEYRAIHPICNSLDCQQMLDAMMGSSSLRCPFR
jgi:hypothetical protein